MTPLTIALAQAKSDMLDWLAADRPAAVAGDPAKRREYRENAVALATLATLAEQRGDLVSTRQLAERLGVSARTIRRRRKAGELKPALELGKRVLRWRPDAAVMR